MSEHFPDGTERQQKPQPFQDFPQILEQFVSNNLGINKVQALTRNRVTVDSDSSTWVSSASREGGVIHVRIGEQKLPRHIAEQFKWGAETVEQEYVVKVAHEYAHVVQDMFDQHLLRWLDGSNDIPEQAIPYIQLYTTLSTIGGLHGLSTMGIYHEQSKTSGNLSVPLYEDMAETIGSYLLGSEYLLYRIQNAHGQITQEQAEELVEYVVKVVSTWEKDSTSPAASQR